MKKPIGIIGGMGPEASALLYTMLVDMAVKEFDAKHNDEFPNIVLHSLPVPDFISDEKQRRQALKMLKQSVRYLNTYSLSSIAIACNTAHILLPSLKPLSKATFVSIIDVVVKEVVRQKLHTVGVLGTPSTLRYGLYQEKLLQSGVQPIVPTSKQIDMLESVIRNVLAGKILAKDAKTLTQIAETLKKQGAEGIILGCTELPLVFPTKYSLPVFNSLQILARALLQRYYKLLTIGTL